MTLPGWVVQAAIIAALGFWSAALAQRGVAVFHDGLRPPMGELVAGRMTRAELGSAWRALNRLLALWFVPFSLATGVILTHVLLLPTDGIGARARSWQQAGIAGAVFGALLVIVVTLARSVLSALPVSIPDALFASLQPLVYGVIALPAVAAGYQFGWTAGAAALAATLAGQLVNLSLPSIGGNVLSLLAGLLVLGLYTYRAEQKRRADADEDAIEPLESNAARIRQHRGWLAAQGALLALAVNTAAFGWFALDMSAAAYGFRVEAALVALTVTLGFLPTVVTSSSLTGVAQAVGLTLAFAAGYLAPHPAVAALLGAAIMALEAVYLPDINRFLDSHPTVREVGDSARGAMQSISALALVGGAIAAAQAMLPGGAGVLIVVAVAALNELTGSPIVRMAEGPVAVVVAGVVANALYLLGVRP